MIACVLIRYNLCSGSVDEARALCRRLLDEVFLPSLAKDSRDFDEMGHVLIEALWPINPYMDATAFIVFTLTLASSAATNNNHSLKIGNSFAGSFNLPTNVKSK